MMLSIKTKKTNKMDKFNDLKEIVAQLEEEATKFYEKNNKAAGVRLRKGLQDIKTLAQTLRQDVSAKNNEGK
jgi:hypothetical protein